jgi:TetR/AcrR family transcriptional regulator, transcriptional repressor for nem operon
MARPQEFDRDEVLDAAISVFQRCGFEGSSAAALTSAMGIGRQSLYNAFGDKWQLYREAVRHYALREGDQHIAALRSGANGIGGIRAFLARIADDPATICLGVGSVCEFGTDRGDLSEIHQNAGHRLQHALAAAVTRAQAEGDVDGDVSPTDMATFLLATASALRVAARGGADRAALGVIASMALRAVR